MDRKPAEQRTSVAQRSRRAALQLTGRAIVVRGLSLFGTIVLARLLSPEDFGAFAIISLGVTLLTPFAEFGLAPALIQRLEPPTERDMATVFTLQLTAAVVLYAVVWIVAPGARLMGPSLPADFDTMVRVTALMIPLAAVRALPVAMMARDLRFGPLATAEVVQVVLYVGISIALALAGAGAWSFVGGLVAFGICGALLPSLAWGRRPRLGFDAESARPLLRFGLPFQATSLLVASRDALVPIFGGLAGGVVAVGYLNLGMRLGRLAGGVDEIVNRVAFPAFSRLQDSRPSLDRAVRAAVELTALLLAMLLAWPIAVAPTLIPLVFSEQWRPAVPVFILVAMATMALTPSNFMRGLAFAARRTRAILVASAGAIGLAYVLFPALIISLGVAGGALAFLVYSVVQLLANVRATNGVAHFAWLPMLRVYGLAAAAAVPASAVNAIAGGIIGLVLSGVLFAGLFLGLMYLFQRDTLRRAVGLRHGRTAAVPPIDDGGESGV